jgi:hypothetical protein
VLSTNVIEQRIAADLVLVASRSVANSHVLHVLAFDSDGGLLGKIATVQNDELLPLVWSQAIEAAMRLYPRNLHDWCDCGHEVIRHGPNGCRGCSRCMVRRDELS